MELVQQPRSPWHRKALGGPVWHMVCRGLCSAHVVIESFHGHWRGQRRRLAPAISPLLLLHEYGNITVEQPPRALNQLADFVHWPRRRNVDNLAKVTDKTGNKLVENMKRKEVGQVVRGDAEMQW